jgi:hypothetical protein
MRSMSQASTGVQSMTQKSYAAEAKGTSNALRTLAHAWVVAGGATAVRAAQLNRSSLIHGQTQAPRAGHGDSTAGLRHRLQRLSACGRRRELAAPPSQRRCCSQAVDGHCCRAQSARPELQANSVLPRPQALRDAFVCWLQVQRRRDWNHGLRQRGERSAIRSDHDTRYMRRRSPSVARDAVRARVGNRSSRLKLRKRKVTDRPTDSTSGAGAPLRTRNRAMRT